MTLVFCELVLFKGVPNLGAALESSIGALTLRRYSSWNMRFLGALPQVNVL